ncbi:MAG: hypothetical protein AAGA48_27345 [Myxococcota bacterium]
MSVGRRRLRNLAIGLLVVVLVLAWFWPWSSPAPTLPEVLPTPPATPPVVAGDEFPEDDEPLGLPEHVDVHCELSRPVRAVLAYELDLESSESLGRIPATVDGAWVTLQPRQALGMAWFYPRDYEPVAVGWLGGACTQVVQLTPRPRGFVHVALDGEDPEEVSLLAACFEGSARMRHDVETGAIDTEVVFDRGRSSHCEVLVTDYGGDEPVQHEFSFQLEAEEELRFLVRRLPDSDAGWQLLEEE